VAGRSAGFWGSGLCFRRLPRPTSRKEGSGVRTVSTYRADDGDRLVQGFRSVTDQLEDIEGFVGAYFLVDRVSGKALSMTLWEDEAAINASRQKADELRQQGTGAGGGSIESIEHYEVAMSLGGVPQA
jgi:heme-degrading monooxygenase HmoA